MMIIGSEQMFIRLRSLYC